MDTIGEMRQVCEAVAYAYDHGELSAAQVLKTFGQDPSDREVVLFSTLLSVIERDAFLLGRTKWDHVDRLIDYYC